MVVALRVVLPLQFDVVTHAREVDGRRGGVLVGVRHAAERREVDAVVRRGVERAGARVARAIFGGDVVLRAGRRRDRLRRAEDEAGIVGDGRLDRRAVRGRQFVLAVPVGMDVVLGVEAARDVVALSVVAVARRVEVGEVRAFRGEHPALDRVPHQRVERDDLCVLGGVVRLVQHRARDELRVRLLVQDLPDKVGPHGIQLRRRRAVGVEVVRAEHGEDEIDVAALVEHILDRIHRAGAVLGYQPLGADSRVPHPFLRHTDHVDNIIALDLPESLGNRLVPGGGEVLHERDAPVAVRAVVALRDGVARAEEVNALLRRGVVEVEPEASAAAFKVLRPHFHVRAVGAGCVEDGGERGGVHVQGTALPVHQEEAPLRRRGVVRRQRELRAGREHGRLDERQAELHGIVREPPRRAHVDTGDVEAAHLREGRRAVEHEDRRHGHAVAGGIGERLRYALGEADQGVRDKRRKRRRAIFRPVAGRCERGVRRARPHGGCEIGARGRGHVRVLHPTLDADEGIRRAGDVAEVRVVELADACPVERLRGYPVVAVNGERAHAKVARGCGADAPASVGEDDFRRREHRGIGEPAHDLKASVAVGAGGFQVVVEAVCVRPGFSDDVAGYCVRAGVVDGVELNVAINRVVIRRHLPNAAEVAPHMELLHRLLLALSVRDGERHVVERGAGGVHVDPHGLQCTRVLAHQLDVVAGLRDVRCLHGGRVGVRNTRCVLNIVLLMGGLQHAGSDESVEVRGGHVVRGAKNDRRTHPAGRRVLAVRRRERHQLRLQHGGSRR